MAFAEEGTNDLCIRALALRESGETYRAIGEALGFCPGRRIIWLQTLAHGAKLPRIRAARTRHARHIDLQRSGKQIETPGSPWPVSAAPRTLRSQKRTVLKFDRSGASWQGESGERRLSPWQSRQWRTRMTFTRKPCSRPMLPVV